MSSYDELLCVYFSIIVEKQFFVIKCVWSYFSNAFKSE